MSSEWETALVSTWSSDTKICPDCPGLDLGVRARTGDQSVALEFQVSRSINSPALDFPPRRKLAIASQISDLALTCVGEFSSQFGRNTNREKKKKKKRKPTKARAVQEDLLYRVGRSSMEIQDGILKIEDSVLGLWAARLDFTDSARVAVVKENITPGRIESS